MEMREKDMRFIIEHLEKHFDKKEVLKDIDFTFEEGKIYGLLGRNGAGKTTLFNCINRDIKADGGSFYLVAGGYRVCAVHAGSAGVPDRAGVSEVLSGY